jgi:hypothetical protein
MTKRDGASELPYSNEVCDPIQGGTPRKPTDRRTAVAEFRVGYPTELNRRGFSGFGAHTQWIELNRWWGRERNDSGRDACHATSQTARAIDCPMTGCCGSGSHPSPLGVQFIPMALSHVFGVPMKNQPLMVWRDVASELPLSNEGCDPPQGGTPRTPTARGPAVADFKTVLQLNTNDSRDGH